MLITFSRKLPDGSPSNFKDKILDGTKIHTIRATRRGKRQIETGDELHLWDGSPRNTRGNSAKIPGSWVCSGVEPAYILFDEQEDVYSVRVMVGRVYAGSVNYTQLSWENVKRLAENDGLTINQFVNWFWEATNKGTELFQGFIIHWTSLRS